MSVGALHCARCSVSRWESVDTVEAASITVAEGELLQPGPPPSSSPAAFAAATARSR